MWLKIVISILVIIVWILIARYVNKVTEDELDNKIGKI